MITAWALIGFSGCGGGGSGVSSAGDQAFLGDVHNAVPAVSSERTDTQLVRLGHAVCDGFGAGASFQELADRLALQGAHPLPTGDLGAVISAAATDICPKYRTKVS